MTKTLAAVFVALACVNACFAVDITTRSGTTYRKCEVVKVEPDGIRISHDGGAAKISFEELPDALQRQYGYDAAKVASYRKSIADAKAAGEAKAVTAKRERDDAAMKKEQEARRQEDEKQRQDAERLAEEKRQEESKRQAEERQAMFKRIVIIVSTILAAAVFLWFVFFRPGSVLTVVGALIAIYFFFLYDTTVSTMEGRIHNQGLLQNRLLGCIGGLVLFAVGIIISVARSKKQKQIANQEPWK